MNAVTKDREHKDDAPSLVSVKLSLEDRIERIAAKPGLDTVSNIDDLKAVLIIVFRKLGCDGTYSIREIVERVLPYVKLIT